MAGARRKGAYSRPELWEVREYSNHSPAGVPPPRGAFKRPGAAGGEVGAGVSRRREGEVYGEAESWGLCQEVVYSYWYRQSRPHYPRGPYSQGF